MLKAGIAVAFSIDAAHHMRAHTVVGILASRVAHDLDGVKREMLEVRDFLRGDVTLQKQKAAPLAFARLQLLNFCSNFLGVEAERRGHLTGEELRAFHAHWIDDDGLGGDADCEELPGPIGDFSAQCGDLEDMLLLRFGGSFQLFVLGDLELVKSRGDCNGPDQNDAGDYAQAPFSEFLDWESHHRAPASSGGRGVNGPLWPSR